MESKEKMNSYERVMTAFNGEKPDRVPVVLLLREWPLKQVNFTLSEALQYPEKYAYAQYYCLREFGYDAVGDPQGMHAESAAMGSLVELAEGYPPKVVDYAVKDYARDLPKIKMLDPQKDGWLPAILEIVKQLKNLCRGEYPVYGYVQAPFRHASMLRGSDFVLRDVYRNKDNLKELLRITTESQKIWGKALVEAGADIIMVSDPTSSGDAVSPRVWEEFGAPYFAELVKEIKEMGVKVFSHICGDTNDRLESISNLGQDCLSVDQKVDLAYARELLGPKRCIMGNIDPTNLLPFGRPEEVAKQTEKVIEQAGKEGAFVLSGGCLILDAPPENIRAMVKVAQNYYY